MKSVLVLAALLTAAWATELVAEPPARSPSRKSEKTKRRDHRRPKRPRVKTRDHRRAKPRPLLRTKVRTVDHRRNGPAPSADSTGYRPAPVPARVRVRVPMPSVKVRVETWERLSAATSGEAVEATAAAEVPVLITRIFDQGIPEGSVDLVFVVDTTGSMKDDIAEVKRDMRQILAHLRGRNPDSRVGIVAYRDVGDEYLTRTFQFLTSHDPDIENAIAEISVKGGDDWPEHVYAGINTALDGQPWRPGASQHIILLGDAPPHEDYHNDPRNYEMVTRKAQTAPLKVRIHTIGITCDRRCKKVLANEERQRANHNSFRP